MKKNEFNTLQATAVVLIKAVKKKHHQAKDSAMTHSTKSAPQLKSSTGTFVPLESVKIEARPQNLLCFVKAEQVYIDRETRSIQKIRPDRSYERKSIRPESTWRPTKKKKKKKPLSDSALNDCIPMIP